MKFIPNEDLLELTKSSGGKFKVQNLEEAYEFCSRVATIHYENFPVGSILIPKKIRKYFYSVYTFARIADDIADELKNDVNGRIVALDILSKMLSDEKIINQTAGNPLFLALHDTIRVKNLSIELFQRLLIAFKRDIEFEQAEDFEQLEDYCSYSANPIGELVLNLFDIRDKEAIKYSDYICTGLQLVNFWQDLSIDLKNGRCYIPKNLLQKCDLDKENLHDKKKSANLSDCLGVIYNYTDEFFEKGEYLFKYLKYYRLRAEIKATVMGGRKILDKIRVLGDKVLSQRPYLTKSDYFIILIKSLI
jgi:hydroxysqualene synthase